MDVGFSDHTNGFEAGLIAVGLGIKIIEKHFTLSKKMKGPDHKASLDVKEMVNFVKILRSAFKSLGSETKNPLE